MKILVEKFLSLNKVLLIIALFFLAMNFQNCGKKELPTNDDRRSDSSLNIDYSPGPSQTIKDKVIEVAVLQTGQPIGLLDSWTFIYNEVAKAKYGSTTTRLAPKPETYGYCVSDPLRIVEMFQGIEWFALLQNNGYLTSAGERTQLSATVDSSCGSSSDNLNSTPPLPDISVACSPSSDKLTDQVTCGTCCQAKCEGKLGSYGITARISCNSNSSNQIGYEAGFVYIKGIGPDGDGVCCCGCY